MNKSILDKLVSLSSKFDLFLIEAPKNHQPEPPIGYFALRSSKRRVFIQLDNGSIPDINKIENKLKIGEFIE